MSDWVLWGSHPAYAGGVVLKLTGGSLRTCRVEQRYRERCGGWQLAAYKQGTSPDGLRALVL